jgi:uncharacterized protein with HEPN domain
MTKQPKVFLEHILASITAVEEYTSGLSTEEFLASQEKQDAVIRRVEIIGEAVRNLPDDFRKQYPEVTWNKIVGMRDKLIHAYFGVDLDLVWAVVTNDLKPLKIEIESILQQLP